MCPIDSVQGLPLRLFDSQLLSSSFRRSLRGVSQFTMMLKFLDKQSIKTRVTVSTLAIFLVSIWVLTFFVQASLKADLRALVGEQQRALSRVLADQIDAEFRERFAVLKHHASGGLGLYLQSKPGLMQQRLDESAALKSLFNGGIWLCDKGGTVVASDQAALIGKSFADQEYMVTVLKDGKHAVGKPARDATSKGSGFAMAVPIFDTQGAVIGAMVGLTDLTEPSFLRSITNVNYEKSGVLLLVDPKHRIIALASDQHRTLEVLPPPGSNAVLDQRYSGDESTFVFVNPVGVEVVSSATFIPSTGWFVAVTLPTAQAFAPVQYVMQRVIWMSLGLTVIAGFLMLWTLQRAFYPMLQTVRELATIAGLEHHKQRLSIVRHDEVGELIDGFNRLLDVIEAREKTLRHSEERRLIATKSGRVSIWEVDVATEQLRWDENGSLLYQQPLQKLTCTMAEWERAVHPQDFRRVVQAYRDAVDGKGDYHQVFRIFWPNGDLRYIESHGQVERASDGTAERMIGTNWDVTEQKRIEAQLQASLYDKEALLKEVHHRVKNNLQVITSLLRLESQRATTTEANNVLTAMRGRIRAMAQLHESLYRAGTFASIDLGEYIGQIATQAFQTNQLSNQSVQLLLDVETVLIGMDQAIACGLLVNELVSNSLKHGFPAGRTGVVRVDLHPVRSETGQADALWKLQVRDTGVGLPDDFDAKRHESLGLQLVNDLSLQLGGALSISSPLGEGAQFTVVFKALKPKPLVMPV